MKCLTKAVVLFLLGLTLCCCGRKQADEPRRVLTGIRTAVALPLPEGCVPFPSVLPEWEPETQTLLCAAASWTDGEGYGTPCLVRSGADGYEEIAHLPLGEQESVFRGAVRDGALYWLRAQYGDSGIRQLSLERLDEEGGNTVLFTDILIVFSDSINDMRMVCANGTVCIASDSGVAVFDPDGTLRAVSPSPGEIVSLTASPGGEVLLGYRTGNGLSAAFVDLNTGLAGAPADLPEKTTAVSAGDGTYRFFCACGEGITGRTEDGKDEILMDPSASGAGRAEFWFSSASDALFFTEGDMGSRKLLNFIPADDIDLSDTTVMTVAVPFWRGGLSNDEKESFTSFQRTHPGVTVVFDDCERYRVADANLKFSPEDVSDELVARILQANKDMDNRLSTDIVTGLYKPDLLVADVQCGTFTQISRKGLHADLSPLLERDELVKREDLMENVRRLYDDGKGGIWGLARTFRLSTVITAADRMPAAAEKGYMTLSDLLDCLDSLPEGVELVRGWGQDALEGFLSHEKGYLAFVDMEEGTCSFADPVFLRWLSVLKNTEKIPNQVLYGSDAGLIREGAVAAQWQSFWTSPDQYMASCLAFGTKDIAAVGYPSPEPRPGAGTRVESMGNTYVILASSNQKELAWELVRQFIDDYHYADPDSFMPGTGVFPVLKSRFREMNAFLEDRYYCLSSEGWIQSRRTLEELEQRCPGAGDEGKHMQYTAEDGERLMEICEGAGVPLSMTPYEEIGDILSEEVSAFLGGLGTADDCAKKIQSRVSIWLAEHR